MHLSLCQHVSVDKYISIKLQPSSPLKLLRVRHAIVAALIGSPLFFIAQSVLRARNFVVPVSLAGSISVALHDYVVETGRSSNSAVLRVSRSTQSSSALVFESIPVRHTIVLVRSETVDLLLSADKCIFEALAFEGTIGIRADKLVDFRLFELLSSLCLFAGIVDDVGRFDPA